MPLYINGTERTGRTQILASTTTNATLRIHHRYPGRFFIIHILGNHLDSSGRTMTGTVSTTYPVRIHNTILSHPHSMTYLNSRLLSQICQTDGTGRTHLGTLHTFGTAISTLVRHLGLHQMFQITGRTQYLIRAH